MKPEVLEKKFQEKLEQAFEHKEHIAAVVAAHIPEAGVVGLNGGTTTTLVARHLARLKKEVTVVTNAVNIAFELTGSPCSVVVIGGALRPSNYETTGRMAEETLKSLHLDCAVLGANGIDQRFGASSAAEIEASVSRTFANRADQVIVVADSTKLGTKSLFKSLGWSSIHLLASDEDANETLTKWGLRRRTPWGPSAALWEVNAQAGREKI